MSKLSSREIVLILNENAVNKNRITKPAYWNQPLFLPYFPKKAIYFSSVSTASKSINIRNKIGGILDTKDCFLSIPNLGFRIRNSPRLPTINNTEYLGIFVKS